MWIPIALALALTADDADRSSEPTIPSPLSLEQAETIFREHGLDLLIAEAQVRGAEGDLRAAQVVQNPSVSAAFLYGFPVGSSTDSYATPAVPGWSATLSDNAAIEDVISGKRGLRVDVARRALEAARQGRADAERNLLEQVRTAFIQAVLAQGNLDFANDALESYAKTRKLNEIRYDKGDINKADLSRIVVAQLEAQQAIEQAKAQLASAKAALGFLLGVRSHPVDMELQIHSYFRSLSRIDAATPDGLTQEALGHRPDLLAATAAREQAAYALAAAKRQRFPDIALELGYSQQYIEANNGVVGPPTVSVGLQAPIPLFYQQQGEVRRAEANFDAALHQEQKAKGQVVSDVSQAYAGYVAAREMVQRMQKELLDAAKSARDLEELMYQKGGASLLDFLDSERTYIATNLEYRQDLANYWTAVFQLEQATAEKLSE